MEVKPLMNQVFDEEKEEQRLRIMEESIGKMRSKLKESANKEKEPVAYWRKDEFSDKRDRSKSRMEFINVKP